MNDDAKKLILARRARFVAAALVGLATEACGKSTVSVDAGAAEAKESVDGATADPSVVPPVFIDPPPPPPDAGPRPCLTPPRPCLTPPRPCLKPALPSNCDPPFTVDQNGVKHFKPDCM